VDEPDAAVPPLDGRDLAAGLDLAAVPLEIGGQRARHRREVHHAGLRRVQRRDPAGVRLDLAQAVGVEPAQPRHAVLTAAALELVEPGELAVVAGHDQLAAPLERDAVLLAVRVQLARALHAQACLQRPRRVVDPRVHDAAVVPGLVLRDGALALEHHHARVRTAAHELASDG
jgi:hypothetical protein